jgi:hypothetical protein
MAAGKKEFFGRSLWLSQSPAKQAKQLNMRSPEADYEQLSQHHKTHNPYGTSSPSGQGFNPAGEEDEAEVMVHPTEDAIAAGDGSKSIFRP